MRSNLAFVAAMFSLKACQPAPESATPPSQEQEMPQRATITEVIAAQDDAVLAIAGVSMIYKGLREDGKPCIKIGIRESTPEVLAALPKELGGQDGRIW